MTCLVCCHGKTRHPTDTTVDRTRRAMAKAGAVCCELSPASASFYAFDSTCPRFHEADAKTVEARRAWANRETTTA